MSGVKRAGRGFSLIEVLFAVAVLTIGIVGILQLFPPSLRATNEAALRGRAALLAQQKAEEIRRDDARGAQILETIANLPDPTDPVPFTEDDRLVYQFHSRSLLEPDGEGDDPAFEPGVPRVIVRFNPEFGDGKVLHELRFDASSTAP